MRTFLCDRFSTEYALSFKQQVGLFQGANLFFIEMKEVEDEFYLILPTKGEGKDKGPAQILRGGL